MKPSNHDVLDSDQDNTSSNEGLFVEFEEWHVQKWDSLKRNISPPDQMLLILCSIPEESKSTMEQEKIHSQFQKIITNQLTPAKRRQNSRKFSRTIEQLSAYQYPESYISKLSAKYLSSPQLAAWFVEQLTEYGFDITQSPYLEPIMRVLMIDEDPTEMDPAEYLIRIGLGAQNSHQIAEKYPEIHLPDLLDYILQTSWSGLGPDHKEKAYVQSLEAIRDINNLSKRNLRWREIVFNRITERGQNLNTLIAGLKTSR